MTDQRWTIEDGRVPALLWPDDENPDMPFSFAEADLAEMLPDALDRQISAAFAALAEVIARDAQVREIVTANDGEWLSPGEASQLYHDIAALYPEAGK